MEKYSNNNGTYCCSWLWRVFLFLRALFRVFLFSCVVWEERRGRRDIRRRKEVRNYKEQELCFVCFSFLVSWEERRGRRDTRRRKEVRNYKEQELCFMRFSFLVSYERKGEEEEIPVREKRYVTIKNKSFVSCVSLFLRRMRGRRDIRPRIGT